SKTYPSYYAEMLGQLGWPEGPVVIVGNDVQRDLVPADRLGLMTYLIEGNSASSPGPEAGRGRLADFRPWLESQNPTVLEPSFKSPEAIMAIISSTPAVLDSMTDLLPSEQWTYSPSPDDWTLNEVICHLRDTDMEIHALQLRLMSEKEDAFIPRPDSSIWANEREYLQVNGPEKLREFITARIQNINLIRKMDKSVWSRKARHAIFGPTDFTEVVGFIADHDRAHIQQVWKTLRAIQCERV
ncbi:MAG: DinB family protein, partial [Anaerolineales bacterium]|nr:DinB family protein [Anaerolineales bacterium]